MLNPRKLLAAALFVGLGVVLSACEELGEEGGGGLDFGTAGTTTVAITMKLSHFDEPVVIEAPEVKPAETPISVAARSVPTPTPVIAPIPSPTPSRAAAAVRGTATVAPAKVPVPTPAPATPAPTPASVAVPAPIQPPSGLVSWWPGDGNADDVAGGNHGTLVNGATFAPGIVGQAFSLDGADDYVEIGDISDFEITPTTSMSITGWVKTSANGPAMVVTKMDVFSPDFGWLVRVTFQGVLELQIANNDDRVRITTIAVNDDQWHHFASNTQR